jgi:hypothetical protein
MPRRTGVVKPKSVIPGRAEGANPESKRKLSMYVWIPDRRCATSE